MVLLGCFAVWFRCITGQEILKATHHRCMEGNDIYRWLDDTKEHLGNTTSTQRKQHHRTRAG